MSRSVSARRAWRAVAVAAVASLGATLAPAAVAAQPDGSWWNEQWEMHKVRPISDGSGVTVAVLDTGVDASVPELGGSVVAGADFTGQGGDGTIDYDPDSHGTAVTSLIAGADPIGIAPGATILPVVVSADEASHDDAVEAYAQGIRFAVDRSAHVINLSLAAQTSSAVTGECPAALMDAIRYAADNDVVIVAGSGNDPGGFTPFPGGCPGVVTVGANDAQLSPWQESHRSEHVDVSAPGVDINVVTDGYAGPVSGTSGSTALVSGAIALMRAQFPEESADTILRRVIHTAGDIHTDGWDDATGYGVVQPYYALTEELPPDAPNPIYEELEQSGTGPTEGGGLNGLTPLAPDSASDSSSSEGNAPLLVVAAIIGGLLLIAIVVVVIIVVTMSSKNKRRPTGYPPQYPPPPSPYLGSPRTRR